ncbi:F-box domain-containing protein [Mycena venus]|uniref:F-box domain-containing protein n=1 Tax=Mycena venus TaxID=2733690 RepID=A0A8H7CPW7_9AGAR|nr:F-box domain-containing protein [Mycena venus]
MDPISGSVRRGLYLLTSRAANHDLCSATLCHSAPYTTSVSNLMRSDMEADRKRLSDIDAHILELERSLSALLAEKEVVRERLDSYRYPVLTLPNEIVSEIFVHFLPPYPDCPPLLGFLSPTMLTHICRKWRGVALATPMLWRAIKFSDPFITYQRQVQIYDLWIRRSGSFPLSVVMDNYCFAVSAEMIPAIVAHRARWEHLKFYLHSLSCPMTDGPMPLLCHLDLSTTKMDEDVTFHEVPLLRAVILTGCYTSRITLPWVQLTSLTLNNVDPGQCVPILQQTASLVHCHLLLQMYVGSKFFHPPNIMLPCLESLTFNRHCDPLTKFLDCFIVPALRRLEVPEPYLGSTPIQSLELFISKSGRGLQDVCIIEARRVHEDSYRTAFPSIPNFSFPGRYIRQTTDDEDSEDESNSEDDDSSE